MHLNSARSVSVSVSNAAGPSALGSEFQDFKGKCGEPKFRELEPDCTMAEAAQHVAHGSVTRLPYSPL